MPLLIGKSKNIPLLRRFLSFSLDLALAWFVYFYFLSNPLALNSSAQMMSQLNLVKLIALPIDLILNLTLFFFVYLILRLVFTLIFGVSFGQLFLGILPLRQTLWSRIGGLIRVVLESFFMPLKLIDYPIYKQRKSIFEIISFTQLKGVNNFLINPIALVALLLIIFSFIYSPLFQNLAILDSITVSFKKNKEQALKRGDSFQGHKNFSSKKLKLIALANPKESNLSFIPSYEIIKHKKKIKISPELIIYSDSLKVSSTFTFRRDLDLAKIIQIAKSGNPLFSFTYPQLDLMLKKVNAYKKSDFKPEFGNEKLLNPEQRDEIKGLIESSFSISMNTLHKSFLNEGPFLGGHLKFRTSFLNLLDEGAPPAVDIIELGNQDFLRLRQVFQDFPGPFGKKRIDTFIAIGTINSAVYQYSYNEGAQEEELMKKFLNHFLSHAKWYFDYNDDFYIPNKSESMTIFNIIDYFSTNKLDLNLKSELEFFIYNYFFELARDAVLNNDEKLTGILSTSLKRILLIAKYQLKSNDDKKTDNKIFLEQMQGLILAVKELNSSYFNE